MQNKKKSIKSKKRINGEEKHIPSFQRVSQSDIPRYSLEQALKIARVLMDDFGGKSAPPYRVAEALALSPTSSHWRMLSGAAMAYGLTEGAYGSAEISLTELGRRITSPLEEGEDASRKVEAALRPTIARNFFEKYNRAKFPRDEIAKNVLIDAGVPADRASEVLDTLKKNGEFTGVLHNTKTGLFVAIEENGKVLQIPGAEEDEEVAEVPLRGQPEVKKESFVPPSGQEVELPPRVFIAHGKNKNIVQQLKDLLTFGKFVPVVAEEHETTSVPVPEKVMNEMRSCFAGVIHIENEDLLMDEKGKQHHQLNGNVLIEIGAALALYKDKVVLLVHNGVELPSNLQGLYRCEYEGEKLDYEATM